MLDRKSEQFKLAEERVKISHFTQQGFDINGIIQAGVHTGQEYPWYRQMGIDYFIGFEPIPEIYCKFINQYPDALIYNFALGDKNEIKSFNLMGEGDQTQSSSLLLPTDQSLHYLVRPIIVQVIKFSHFAQAIFPRSLGPYDCLVMDIQGYELQAIKGFENWIRQFKYLSIECSLEPIYEGGAPAIQVVEYLMSKGFILDSPLYSHDDVFFIRKDIKSFSLKQYKGLV